MEELLEQLKNVVHAEYISYLPHLPYRRWALVLLENMPLGRYSLWELCCCKLSSEMQGVVFQL